MSDETAEERKLDKVTIDVLRNSSLKTRYPIGSRGIFPFKISVYDEKMFLPETEDGESLDTGDKETFTGPNGGEVKNKFKTGGGVEFLDEILITGPYPTSVYKLAGILKDRYGGDIWTGKFEVEKKEGVENVHYGFLVTKGTRGYTGRQLKEVLIGTALKGVKLFVTPEVDIRGYSSEENLTERVARLAFDE